MNSLEWARIEAGAWPFADGIDHAVTPSSCSELHAPRCSSLAALRKGSPPMATTFDAALRNGHPYLLGHSEAETARLMLQGQIVGPITRRLLIEAGVGVGMSVLDVGAGAGDVALIAADLVGPTGRVLGVDANPEILDVARSRARLNGLRNVEFRHVPIEDLPAEERFDAVVGRFILLHLADPVAALRDLAGRARPGGVVAFHEIDLATGVRSIPPSPLLERAREWLKICAEDCGLKREIGGRIFAAFLEAGLPAPRLRNETPTGGPDFPGYENFAEVVRSALPRLIELGVVTADDVDIETFAARLRAEVGGRGVFSMWPSVLAWTRTPV
jgi:SAM-dependent methyltransferase